MTFLGWINLAFGFVAAIAGVFVLRGVFRRSLSRASTSRFLTLSLIASLAGLMPLTHHFTPFQRICTISVYCSGAAIIAWLKFGLEGRSRRIFAFCITAVVYFDLVYLATRIFKKEPLFTVPMLQPLPIFQIAEIVFAAAFIVLGILAVRKCQQKAPNYNQTSTAHR